MKNFLSRGMRISFSFFCSLLIICGGGAPFAKAQEQDEVVKVRTRVVFLDALVTDRKTKSFAGGLAPENFEVIADGKPRPVSYFTREGDKNRRPLALALVFDLERLGAGRYMRRTEILEAMAAELSKLPAEDEVAVVVLDPNGVEDRREWLTPFTRNRAQTASAMAVIPALVGAGASGAGGEANGQPAQEAAERRAEQAGGVEAAKEENEKPAKKEISITVGTKDGVKVETTGGGEDEFKDEQDEEVEIDYIMDKKGNKIKRIVKPDGALILERTNKDGSTTSDYQEPFDLAAASYEITKRMAAERPNSQAAMVYVTDGIAPVFYAQRDFIESKLLKSNVIFSALVTDMKTGFKFALPILKPLGNLAGISISGSAQHLAKQTGGESVRVRRPADYAKGLSLIVGNLNARYSLGFTLAETEQDDGQMHPLEVRVRARDAKGKERKLEVKARRGYYMPTDAAKKSPEAAKKTSAGAETPDAPVKN
ncbi:MAG: VWA domain-containing protein [Pyrinomonadaceae bacterium]